MLFNFLDEADEDEIEIIHEMMLGLVEGIQGIFQGVGQYERM